MYIQVAFGSSASCDLVWRLGRGLSWETLVSPDKTGNDMSFVRVNAYIAGQTGNDMSFVR